ncbi:hypothetical protein N0V93_009034 [Gnomoniopsis smithogilvyi]|uniref:DUF1993 domain-containing protein n=1 Tax=Gnomoniopsis smithogilvyi TaxID=1191159 RepID=A0A9W9CSE9_9PEZI|nr:hypothetical protein N0V93_009034 [Gnomoniopsis smithogilvyi]
MTSLYKQSIPVLIKYLDNLSVIVGKGKSFADEKDIKHEEVIGFRLVPDMRGLDYQVQSCCNTAKFVASRVGGAEDVFFEDEEKTFDELTERITKTIEVLKKVDPKGFEGKEDEEVLMESKMGTFRFTGQRYVSEFAIPNFHFHLSTAYCILRHQGVPLSAFDYMKGVFEKV